MEACTSAIHCEPEGRRRERSTALSGPEWELGLRLLVGLRHLQFPIVQVDLDWRDLLDAEREAAFLGPLSPSAEAIRAIWERPAVRQVHSKFFFLRVPKSRLQGRSCSCSFFLSHILPACLPPFPSSMSIVSQPAAHPAILVGPEELPEGHDGAAKLPSMSQVIIPSMSQVITKLTTFNVPGHHEADDQRGMARILRYVLAASTASAS